MKKYSDKKFWSRSLGLAFLLTLVLSGCGREQGAMAPTLASITPSSAIQGATVNVTLAGTNFTTGATIGLSGAGITVSNLVVVSSAQITATFTIAPATAVGAQNVTVTSSGRTTSAVVFTVNSSTPTLTSISPNVASQGRTVAVTLTGTNYTAGSTIGLSGTGITVSNTTVVSTTQITAMFAIASNAPLGAQNVTVTTSGGTTGAQVFTVTQPVTVSSTNPANGATAVPINRKITVTFSGPMAPTTITTATFTLVSGVTNVVGVVSYDATNNTAIFAPTAPLAASTLFTATITAGATDTGGNPLSSGGAAPNPWTFTTGTTSDNTAPTVIVTNPANGAVAVPTNQKITATFSEAMDSSTLTAATFTLKQGVTPVTGAVTYAGTTATFIPASALTASTAYTATITIGALDLAGNALAGGLAPNPWTFTTGPLPDAVAPTITSTNPANAAVAVPINKTINATFSKAMDPTTITTGTFMLNGPGTTQVFGAVTYDAPSKVATFTPGSNLAPNATFTATITSGAKDLAGNSLASGLAPNPWTFTTGAAAGPAGPNLGSAATFGSFGGGAGITNQGLLTVINGNIGTTGASTLVTGFHDAGPGCTYTETPLNKGTVNGIIYTAPPPPTVGCPSEGTATTFSIATQAASDALAAFNNLSPASRPGGTDPGAGQLGGLVLAPAIYKSAGGSFLITGSDLTLDGKGDTNAIWVFQMASTLTVGAPGFPRSIILINGAQAKNVFWQVGSAATINAAGGGTMVGTIIASAGVTFSTAGNVAITTLNGRALGLNASVTMVNTVVNVPAP